MRHMDLGKLGMKKISILLGLIIVAPRAFGITPAHVDDFEEAENWYLLHRVND